MQHLRANTPRLPCLGTSPPWTPVVLTALMGLLCYGCQSAADPISGPVAESTFLASTIERHPDGALAKGLLSAPTTIHGMPCQGWVRLLPDGRLSSWELAANTTIQGHELPAASYVWLDDEARLQTCFLSRDTTIQGFLCRGGPFKIATSFHTSGTLRAFFPRAPVTIDGITCASTTQAPVVLYEDGKLASCRLATDTTIHGATVRSGSTIHLAPDGHRIEAPR
ncbi:MAG: hypothetical protein IT456_22795 [Planctomycetes bacterium]|nr:hypothetical protein [Planctomycetota bacterium]